MGSPSSRFSHVPDAWDIVLAEDEDDANPLTLKLVTDGSLSMWEGYDAPALSSDQQVYRERAVLWQPNDGAGHSRRTPETTGTGPDGQIVSSGTSYGNNVTLVVPGVALPAGKRTEVTLPPEVSAVSGRPNEGIEFGANRDFYLTTGARYVVKVDGGDGALTSIDFGANALTIALQPFNGNLYLSMAGSGPIWQFDGAVWTVAGANCAATEMARVNWTPSAAIMDGGGGGSPADHLILVDVDRTGFYHVVAGNDAADFANWIGVAGDPIPIGEPSYIIQKIVASPRVVWFAKTNGVHGLTETGRVENLTPWVERTYHPNNGHEVAFWSDDQRAFVFYAHQYGLVAVPLNGTRQESAQFIQFGGKTANATPIWGRPLVIALHVDGLFAAYSSDNVSYIMRLILERDGSWRWSGSECTIEGETVTFMKVASPGGLPRLWIGTMDADLLPHLYWQSLPVSGNPWVDYLASTEHRFSPTWDVYLPKDDAGSSAPKVVRRYDAVAQGIGNGNTVIVDASADDGEYVEQGWISEGRRASFLASTYQTGTWFDWRLRCSNSEASPIAVETFQARMTVSPEQVDVWTFRCVLAAGQGLNNDAEDAGDPYIVRSRLRAFQRQGPILMPRSPLSRGTLTVKVEQGARIQTLKLRQSNETMVVLTFTVSVLQSEGAIYDVDQYSLADYGATE